VFVKDDFATLILKEKGKMSMTIFKYTTFNIVFFAMLLIALPAFAGPKLEFGDNKWLSIGAGARVHFFAQENNAADGENWSKHFGLENMRLYVNGQIHKYLKIEFNTDCTNCLGDNSKGSMIVLDAIGKFEFNQYINIWAGRQLVPSDRAELDGPYFQNTFDFNKTPFYPSDFGNFVAGRFGRDDGVNLWGALFEDKRLTYVVGVFDGVDHSGMAGRPNTGDNLLWAGRFSYNFWDVEKNPGYYTSSTYYGKGGDILTLAFAIQHHEDGAGTAANQSDFTGYSTDLLMEKVLPNKSVLTFEGEYKAFDTGMSQATFDEALAEGGPGCFCLFDGDSWTATGLYLFPQKLGIGQLQPYVRYTANNPDFSTSRSEIEFGTNYIIDGHNAKISLFYQYGDIATKGRNWTPGVTGDDVGVIKLALQWQI